MLGRSWKQSVDRDDPRDPPVEERIWVDMFSAVGGDSAVSRRLLAERRAGEDGWVLKLVEDRPAFNAPKITLWKDQASWTDLHAFAELEKFYSAAKGPHKDADHYGNRRRELAGKLSFNGGDEEIRAFYSPYFFGPTPYIPT